jgi:hypothetical protein
MGNRPERQCLLFPLLTSFFRQLINIFKPLSGYAVRGMKIKTVLPIIHPVFKQAVVAFFLPALRAASEIGFVLYIVQSHTLSLQAAGGTQEYFLFDFNKENLIVMFNIPALDWQGLSPK